MKIDSNFECQNEFNSAFKVESEQNSVCAKNNTCQNVKTNSLFDNVPQTKAQDKLSQSKIFDRAKTDIYDTNLSRYGDKKLDKKVTFDDKKKSGIAKNLALKLSSFVFLCVAVTTTQDVVKIPVLSQVFSPVTSVIMDEDLPKATSSMTFNFVGVSAKEKKVTFSLNIDNFDATELGSDGCVYLLATGDATEEYLKLIPQSVKDSHKIAISSSAVVGAFSSYIDKTGQYAISPSTKYTLLACCGDKILSRYDLTTRDAVYFKDYTSTQTADESYRYFNVHPIFDSTFDDYTAIMVEFEHTLTHALQQRWLTKDYYLSDPYCAVSCEKPKTDPVQKYYLRMYVSTDHPEDIVYTSTKVAFEKTFYLVKVFDEIAF